MKKYTVQKEIGDAGEYLVGFQIVNTYGWIFRTSNVDIGVDGEIEIIEDGISTSEFIKVQVKSEKKISKSISKSIEKRDLLYWKSLPVPIIILLVDLNSKQIYFKDVNDIQLEANSKNSQTIHFNKENRFLKKNKNKLKGIVTNFYNIKENLTPDHEMTQIFSERSYYRPYTDIINECHSYLEKIMIHDGYTNENEKLFTKARSLILALKIFKDRGEFFGEIGKKIIEKIFELDAKLSHIRRETGVAHNGSFG